MKKNIKEIAELNKWQYVPLSTLFSFQYGDGNTNPSNGGKYPVYGANGIIGGYDKYNSESAIIIGHMGENAGSVIWEDKKHFVTYNGTITTSKDEKKLFLKYGYYNLLNLNLRKICAGSGQPFLSYDDLNRLYTTLPNLPTQKKIVTVLSALDYKIALNRRMNTKLEQMSKRLYNHWFVQFDFPNADGKPYKSSGGKMEYNETLKREIPEGWKVKRLGDVCEIVLGGTPSTANNEFWDNGTISWLNSGEVGIFPIVESEKKITEIAVEKSTTEFLKAGSVTLSITRYLRPSILAIDACINQSVDMVSQKSICKKQEKNGVRACPVVTTMIFVHRPRPAPGQ